MTAAPKLSTGQDSTLGNYRDLCAAVFGEKSKPVEFFDNRIKASTNGRNEIVLAAESQMMQIIGSMLP